MNEDIIVVLTSYPKRFNCVPIVVNSMLNQTVKPYKIVLTIYKNDVSQLTDEIRQYIDRGDIELLIANEDLRPHNKYFYVMKKYRENPIVTIDDDQIYKENLIEVLLQSYRKYPKCISAARVHLKTSNKYGLKRYDSWIKEYTKIIEPDSNLIATGVGGILYPPNILKVSDRILPIIRKYITVDDLVLNYLEDKLHLKVVYTNSKDQISRPFIENSQETALFCFENKVKNSKGRTANDECIIGLLNPLFLERRGKVKGRVASLRLPNHCSKVYSKY